MHRVATAKDIASTTRRPLMGAFLLFGQGARRVSAESLWDYEAIFILQLLFGNVARTPSFASVYMELSEITALPPAARAERYRALAKKARGDASEADDSEYISYLLMAEEWERLALLADKEAASRAAK